MKNITTALYTLFSAAPANTFYTAVGGHLYDTQAPEDATFPYAVYQVIVNTNPMDTFVESMQEVLIQFTLVSDASSSGEVKDMLTYLKALYNGATFSITSNTLVYMRWENDPVFEKDDDGDWIIISEFRLLAVAS